MPLKENDFHRKLIAMSDQYNAWKYYGQQGNVEITAFIHCDFIAIQQQKCRFCDSIRQRMHSYWKKYRLKQLVCACNNRSHDHGNYTRFRSSSAKKICFPSASCSKQRCHKIRSHVTHFFLCLAVFFRSIDFNRELNLNLPICQMLKHAYIYSAV